ncbi:MAG TPA: hypothetical protein VK644_01545 [Chitinophagaceae bacterium]|nr:hypothetical protein [Chitinophagaceae bacterium]
MKKFSISSDQVKKAFKKLSLAIIANPILPALSNVLVRVTKGQVEFITSNNDLTISEKCEANAAEEFDLLLPFEDVYKYVGLLKSVTMVIEHPSARKARFSGDNDVYEFNSLVKVEDFAKIPSVPKGNALHLDESFVGWLSKAMETTSKKEDDKALTRACLDITPKGIFLVSTDSYFLFKRKLEGESKIADQLHFSHRLAAALQGSKELEVSWSKNMLCFQSGTTTIWAKRYEDKYPNYNSILPDYESNLVLDRAAFMHALDKMCLSSLATRQTTFSLKETVGSIQLVTDDPDYQRKLKATVQGAYEGPVAVISLNAKRLLTIMHQVDHDTIRLHIHDKTKAVLVSTEEDPAYIGLIMPLKLD